VVDISYNETGFDVTMSRDDKDYRIKYSIGQNVEVFVAQYEEIVHSID
jgi:hypothetical protein